MAQVIKNMNDLKNIVNIAINKAIESTAITVMDKLHDCIDVNGR